MQASSHRLLILTAAALTSCWLSIVKTSVAFAIRRRRLHQHKQDTACLLMWSLSAGAAALMAAQYPSLSVTNMKASMLASVTPVAGLTGYCQTNVSLAHSHNHSSLMQLVGQAY